MSKSVRALLWTVLAATAIVGLAAPFVRFMFLTPSETNLAVVLTPTEAGVKLLMAVGIVSLAIWAYRRTRKKQP